jgi:hypothetical protein
LGQKSLVAQEGKHKAVFDMVFRIDLIQPAAPIPAASKHFTPKTTLRTRAFRGLCFMTKMRPVKQI